MKRFRMILSVILLVLITLGLAVWAVTLFGWKFIPIFGAGMLSALVVILIGWLGGWTDA